MYAPNRRSIANLVLLTILIVSIQGQPTQAGHGAYEWTRNGDHIYYDDGNVGIGIANPGEDLHVLEGNILIEGAGETALKIKRQATFTGESGVSKNPIFEFGRITQGGDHDPQVRFLYRDDATSERSVFEFDRKGIVASVKPEPGSHFEGFIINHEEPFFRLNSSPSMRLEMGDGTNPVDVAVQREMTNTLTFRTNIISPTFEGIERLRVDSSGVEIRNGYFKLPMISGPPPADDCNSADEIGRMKVDANPASRLLYVCTAPGWGKISLFGDVSLPAIHR
jgi:hypothetical protein